jgi:hypothetical protein
MSANTDLKKQLRVAPTESCNVSSLVGTDFRADASSTIRGGANSYVSSSELPTAGLGSPVDELSAARSPASLPIKRDGDRDWAREELHSK